MLVVSKQLQHYRFTMTLTIEVRYGVGRALSGGIHPIFDNVLVEPPVLRFDELHGPAVGHSPAI